jgi:hypothetical protein
MVKTIREIHLLNALCDEVATWHRLPADYTFAELREVEPNTPDSLVTTRNYNIYFIDEKVVEKTPTRITHVENKECKPLYSTLSGFMSMRDANYWAINDTIINEIAAEWIDYTFDEKFIMKGYKQ